LIVVSSSGCRGSKTLQEEQVQQDAQGTSPSRLHGGRQEVAAQPSAKAPHERPRMPNLGSEGADGLTPLQGPPCDRSRRRGRVREHARHEGRSERRRGVRHHERVPAAAGSSTRRVAPVSQLRVLRADAHRDGAAGTQRPAQLLRRTGALCVPRVQQVPRRWDEVQAVRPVPLADVEPGEGAVRIRRRHTECIR